MLQRKEKKAKWYKKNKKFDDGKKSMNGEGRKQRRVFQSLNEEKIKERGTTLEIEGGNVTDSQETQVNANETSRQTNCKQRRSEFLGQPPLETSKSRRGPCENDMKCLKSFQNLLNYIKIDNFTDVSRLDGFTLDMYILTKEKNMLART